MRSRGAATSLPPVRGLRVAQRGLDTLIDEDCQADLVAPSLRRQKHIPHRDKHFLHWIPFFLLSNTSGATRCTVRMASPPTIAMAATPSVRSIRSWMVVLNVFHLVLPMAAGSSRPRKAANQPPHTHQEIFTTESGRSDGAHIRRGEGRAPCANRSPRSPRAPRPTPHHSRPSPTFRCASRRHGPARPAPRSPPQAQEAREAGRTARFPCHFLGQRWVLSQWSQTTTASTFEPATKRTASFFLQFGQRVAAISQSLGNVQRLEVENMADVHIAGRAGHPGP